MKKISQTTLVLGIFMLCGFFTANAQICNDLLRNRVLLNETGTVFSAKKGQVSVISSADKATVKIKKTGGRAKTDVRVYVDGSLVNSDLDFANGNYTTGYRTKVLNNVQGKNIMVQIDNKSVGHTFGYEVKIEGETRSLMNPPGLHTGKVTYLDPHKFYITNPTCGNKVRVIVRRTKPGNKIGIGVYEKDASGKYTVAKGGASLEAGADRKIIDIDSKKTLQIRIYQHGNATINYTVNALSIN